MVLVLGPNLYQKRSKMAEEAFQGDLQKKIQYYIKMAKAVFQDLNKAMAAAMAAATAMATTMATATSSRFGLQVNQKGRRCHLWASFFEQNPILMVPGAISRPKEAKTSKNQICRLIFFNS